MLGDELSGQALTNELTAYDLPRSGADPARAIIGDPRNGENAIVSQLQGLMLILHNRLANDKPELSFEAVQRELRFHYQWVVLEDFLPTIISEAVLREVLPHRVNGTDLKRDKPKLEFYDPQNSSFMPLEFSAAAYRFGHSMVRAGYRLNDAIGPRPIFPVADKPDLQALTGFGRFPNEWAIDWGRFIDLQPRPFGDENDRSNPDNARRLQPAYMIDTAIVDPLGHLPTPQVVSDPPPNLASRNLLRGWRMRLPRGLDVARMMGVEIMADADVRIGKFTNDETNIKGDIVKVAGDVFKGNCPLWTYVLAETKAVETPFDDLTPDFPNNQLPNNDRASVVTALKALGEAMVEDPPPTTDPLESTGNSLVPPIYAYWGQFIDHDLSTKSDRDPTLSDITLDDLAPLTPATVASGLKHQRELALNLDFGLRGRSDLRPGLSDGGRRLIRRHQSEGRYRCERAERQHRHAGRAIPPKDDLNRDLPRVTRSDV